MFAFIRNFLLAVVGIVFFVWLLTIGAMIALVLLFLVTLAYAYIRLVRSGIIHPPSRWAQYRQRQESEKDVIEAEYTVVEDEEEKR